jgi:hypothetical protein
MIQFWRKFQTNRALQKAASQGDIGGVRAALAKGASELDKALLQAIRQNHLLTVVYLLGHGANPNAGDTQGEALGEAARLDHVEIAEILLERGANPNSFGKTASALVHAAARQRLGLCELLLKAGADPNWTSIVNETDPLHFAVHNSDLKLARMLIKYGANPNSFSLSYEFINGLPLLNALACNDFAMAELLIQHGANFEEYLSDGLPVFLHFEPSESAQEFLKRSFPAEAPRLLASLMNSGR